MTKNKYAISELVKNESILEEFTSILKSSRNIKTITGEKNGKTFYNENTWN